MVLLNHRKYWEWEFPHPHTPLYNYTLKITKLSRATETPAAHRTGSGAVSPGFPQRYRLGLDVVSRFL